MFSVYNESFQLENLLMKDFFAKGFHNMFIVQLNNKQTKKSCYHNSQVVTIRNETILSSLGVESM